MNPRRFFLFSANLVLALVMINHSNLYAQDSSATLKQSNSYQTMIVTANEYAAFLNEVAKTDSYNLYDSAIGTDPSTATILRVGTPGNYSYEVLAGREESPVSYVNGDSAMRFCDWMGNNSQVTEAIGLRSSTSPLSIIENSNASFLSLITKDSSTTISNNNDLWEEIGSLAALSIAACVMVKEGQVAAEQSVPRSSPLTAENQPALTLQDFRVAAEAHPTAERLVIHEDGTIRPSEVDPNASGRNRSENMAITQAFRAAVEQEHPTRVNDLLPLDSGMIQNPRHLSSASLKKILREIVPQEESSDGEGETSEESMNMSNRFSESSLESAESLTNTPLENALKLLQAREKEWNRAHPDRV
ncbi:MAG: hypothetical protein ACH346_06105, partial [Chthoniobacterales bacterium]